MSEPSAAEFASRLLDKAKESELYWANGENDAWPDVAFISRCKTRADTWNRVQAMILNLAREMGVELNEKP